MLRGRLRRADRSNGVVNGGPPSNRFAWVMAGFAFVASVLGVGTLIVVYWVMANFRAEIAARHPDIVNDPAYMEALAIEQRVMMAIAALVGVGVLVIVAGTIQVFRSRGRVTS
jgi:hypothetical protein